LKAVHQHHEIFSRFQRWSGVAGAGFDVDFLGSKYQTKYFAMAPAQPNSRTESPGYPAFDEEYFEWVDLLEAVSLAKDRFTMLELGAGWGRWTARGAAAAKLRSLQYWLVAVEAEPTHFVWLKENLEDNAVRPENCQTVCAAVTGKDGSVGFQVGDAASFYGQSIGGSSEVPAVSLATLLEPLTLVDLIDMDVQGAELEILEAAVSCLQKKVRRVHVETHSKQLHREVRALFEGMGWHCHCLFEGNTGDATPWGRINFQSGVQSWMNPALHTKLEIKKAGTYRNSLAFETMQAGRRVLDRFAPIGTVRRGIVRLLLSGFAARFRRDADDESLRPTAW
jgi:FkbM family methyltransferase